MTNDAGGSGAPRFDVVLRGYDRRQVDEHVARMQRIIGRMRADLELARSQPLPIVAPQAAPARPTPSANGSPDVVGSFTDRMQSILQAAEDEAAEIRKKAHASARSEVQSARAEVADLTRQREFLSAEVGRLRGQVETALSGPTAKLAPVARKAVPSPTRRDPAARPSPKPRTGAQPAVGRPRPSPTARQAATGPQDVVTPPPPVVAKPAPEPVAAARDESADRDDVTRPAAAPTAAVPVTSEPRGKAANQNAAAEPREKQNDLFSKPTPAQRAESAAPAQPTVRVAAVRPEPARPENGHAGADRAAADAVDAEPAEAEAGTSSRR